MDIRLVSSFTADDEDQFAKVLLHAISDLLIEVPVAYSVRIETAGGMVLHDNRLAAMTEKSGDGDVSHPLGRTFRRIL